MSLSVLCAEMFGVVIALYILKALLFRFVRSPLLLPGGFFLGVALVVYLVWLTSPASDWNPDNDHNFAVWLGEPILVLAVPCVSFLIDYYRDRWDMRYWFIRIPIEVLVVFPVWAYLWFRFWIWLIVYLDWVPD